jgi:hypothetical protein
MKFQLVPSEESGKGKAKRVLELPFADKKGDKAPADASTTLRHLPMT